MYIYVGDRKVMAAVEGKGHGVCISFSANTFGKGMNLTYNQIATPNISLQQYEIKLQHQT